MVKINVRKQTSFFTLHAYVRDKAFSSDIIIVVLSTKINHRLSRSRI